MILGVLFIMTPDTFVTNIFRNPQTIRIVGIAAVIFFGVAGVYGLRKLFVKTIGLTIDKNGITDNTNASSVGLINWTDITKIRTEEVMSTKFLLIFIDNPEKYLDKVNSFKRKLLKGNTDVTKSKSG